MAFVTITDRPYSDKERWIRIYPAYLNRKKTLAEGRRVPKEKAVDNPTHQEIRDVLTAAGFRVGVENKLYCRERGKELNQRGCIRLQLKNDDGTPFKEELATRDSVLHHLCDMIPKLKSRNVKSGGSEQGGQPSTSQGGGKKAKKNRR
ncbi:unnamed protein product [Bemisia tabaci]|uniref:Signal recognition particle 19 kDa protein n=1 Tax=Bemisia tabaci TaxID=7038 RepID=A0A9P0F7C5_BEMTA|nr:PREDICTED: signal recognition particle 19 kDa protein [Bemisia tabaci]CAH0395095.1 unnamed protein product [Bemisia tabaci]